MKHWQLSYCLSLNKNILPVTNITSTYFGGQYFNVGQTHDVRDVLRAVVVKRLNDAETNRTRIFCARSILLYYCPRNVTLLKPEEIVKFVIYLLFSLYIILNNKKSNNSNVLAQLNVDRSIFFRCWTGNWMLTADVTAKYSYITKHLLTSPRSTCVMLDPRTKLSQIKYCPRFHQYQSDKWFKDNMGVMWKIALRIHITQWFQSSYNIVLKCDMAANFLIQRLFITTGGSPREIKIVSVVTRPSLLET